MAHDINFTTSLLSKEQRYTETLQLAQHLLAEENDLIANMANMAALLRQAFGFFWVGFYRMVAGELRLAPFQGTVACTRIALHRGVCGAAVTRQSTVVVPNVDEFEGHIACSSLSKSEIVVPALHRGDVVFVLDVDSDRLREFDDTDRHFLEKLVAMMLAATYQNEEEHK